MTHTIEDMAVTEATALRADAQRNRERIIAAAIEVFAERGLEASTAEIAQRAGVGEATLFRRFPSKDDLIMAIVETQMDSAVADGRRVPRRRGPGRRPRALSHLDGRALGRRQGRHGRDQGPLHDARRASADPPRVHRGDSARSSSAPRPPASVRDDLTGQDLGILIHSVAASAELPFPGVRNDIWKRYLGVVLDGLRPDGATKLRPGPPPRRAFEDAAAS